MFGFGKRKRSSGLDRFYILLLAGDGSALKIMEPIAALSDSEIERTTILIDDDGNGGMVVTSDDPAPLKAQYVRLGFKVGTVSIPRRRPAENAHLVAMDLRITGEYQQLRRDWLGLN